MPLSSSHVPKRGTLNVRAARCRHGNAPEKETLCSRAFTLKIYKRGGEKTMLHLFYFQL
uniref:Uncharacterized protein n=1 Tax=Anguilla anguilla TaxID=7936 RepID=A0A0E9QJV1_ANGAN